MTLPAESEKHFQAEVVRLCRVKHKRVFFTQRSKGSPEGWPDLVIVDPPWLRIRELKTDTGRLTPAQEETQALLEECVFIDVGVWRPKDWADIVQTLNR